MAEKHFCLFLKSLANSIFNLDRHSVIESPILCYAGPSVEVLNPSRCLSAADLSNVTVALQKEAYNPEDVAKILARSVETIRRWLRAGTIRASKLGQSSIIFRAKLERILSGESKTS
jgi:hypothetical protein